MRKQSVSTIRDVARAANVSTATVSHVFNDTRPVSEATRQAVLDAARRLNYRPSAIARSLTTRRTYTVGVVVADVLNPFFAGIIRGVEDLLWQQGRSLVVCSTDEQPEKEAYYLHLLLERRVDGVLVAPTGADLPVYAELQHHHIPAVFIDRRPPQPWGPTVETDNVRAGYAATRYLLDRGHTRIAILGRHQALSTVTGRFAGYRQALAEADITPDPSLAVTVDSHQEAALQGTLALLARRDPPTALIAANHVMTLGVVAAMRELGRQCPRELSFIAFDDLPWLALVAPPLTAVRHATAEICRCAVDLLMAAMNGQSTERNGTANYPIVTLPAELIERASCAHLDKAC